MKVAIAKGGDPSSLVNSPKDETLLKYFFRSPKNQFDFVFSFKLKSFIVVFYVHLYISHLNCLPQQYFFSGNSTNLYTQN